jgi:hypothetical protein
VATRFASTLLQESGNKKSIGRSLLCLAIQLAWNRIGHWQNVAIGESMIVP